MYNKKFEELTFTDNFMFGSVVKDEEYSRGLLSCLLQRPIGELQDLHHEHAIKCYADGKGIQLDLYSREQDIVYDAEMQNLNKKSVKELDLEKRSRFYHSMIDTDYLNNGGRYRDLPESNVIFICTFDPFGMNHPIYLFSMKEEGYPEHSLKEGTMTYFFNTTYEGNDIPQELINLYRYIQIGEVSDEFTDMLERRVKELRRNEELRSDYMKELVLAMDYKEEGREEGREEERANTAKEKQRADAAEAELAELKKKLKESRTNEEMWSDYMKERTWAMDIRDEGREEERANTAKERQRADAAEAENIELKKELEALKSQILLLSKQQ